jgi:hypothetical protein
MRPRWTNVRHSTHPAGARNRQLRRSRQIYRSDRKEQEKRQSSRQLRLAWLPSRETANYGSVERFAGHGNAFMMGDGPADRECSLRPLRLRPRATLGEIGRMCPMRWGWGGLMRGSFKEKQSSAVQALTTVPEEAITFEAGGGLAVAEELLMRAIDPNRTQRVRPLSQSRSERSGRRHRPDQVMT